MAYRPGAHVNANGTSTRCAWIPAPPSGTFQHDHDGGTPHRFEAAGELEAAGRGADSKRRDRIALLVARIQELAAGIEGQGARIVRMYPDFRNHPQLAVIRRRENRDGIVQPV